MCKSVKDRTIEFVKTKGITMKSFEEKCDLSSGYVTSMRKGFGDEKLKNVLTAFPELNRDWLLYGEGNMFRDVSITQTSHGNNSPNIAGNGNNVAAPTALDKALDEIAEMRKLLDKSIQNNKEQADKFFALIELIKNTDK